MLNFEISKIFSKSLMAITILAMGSLSMSHAHANQNNEGGLSSADLSMPVGDSSATGVADPLLERLKELVAKGKSSNQANLLQDSEMRELKILINRYGFTQLGKDGILSRQEWKNILRNRAQQQRDLWRKLAPEDGMNDIRLSAAQRLNKCIVRSQADYFMSLEEDAMEHRNGMSEIFTDNAMADATRTQKLKELNRKTATNKNGSKGLYSKNVKSCRDWVSKYNAWLKKHEADLKLGKKPSEEQPLFSLQTR